MVDARLADWLLDSDPALRWQVERDLLGAAPEIWQATRARVPHEGVGSELLDEQDVDWLLEHQQDDGGWNCEWVDGSRVSSFHSTLNALIGLLDYQIRTGDAARVAKARSEGEEYLLARDLFRRRSSGEPFDDRVFVLFHPRRWFYGVLPAADYFRRASQAEAAAPDLRMTEAIESIRGEREDDGSWLQGHRLEGDVWFHVDVLPGQPSKWVTFHASRILEWWDGAHPSRPFSAAT